MQIERRVVLTAPPATVYQLIDDLAQYPTWMELVHHVTAARSDTGSDSSSDDAGLAAWDVELRAQIGPLARSKRLRMVRTVHDAPHRAVFERSEVDGRAHAPWVLDAQLTPHGDGGSELSMTLRYGGSLWTGALLQRVLDDHVERGAAALAAMVAGGD